MRRPNPSKDTRLDILEHEVKGLQHTVKDAVRTLGEIRDVLAHLPAQSSGKDRLYMIGGTVAVYTTLLSLLNGWFDGRLAPTSLTMSRIERTTDDLSVLRYRLEQLETRSLP